MIEQLHFLRPMWFLMFIPLLWLVVLIWRRRLNSMSWKAVCDEQLLPHILTRSEHRTNHLPLIMAALASSLCIIAAAGPVLQKLPQPVYKEQSALVILLDLSQSMNATDLRPSRLARARLKLLDLLKTRKAGQTALMVYAADTFVVTPLTDDTNTISNLVPTLETTLMPSQGSHAYIALKKSAELLKQAGVRQGHILLMTDGLHNRDLEAIDELTTLNHRVSIMGLGTADGSPVPVEGGFLQDNEGAIVIPRLETDKLQQAAHRGQGFYVSLQADDSDLDRLRPLFESRKIETPAIDSSLNPMDLTADSWQEEGPWLLLLVIPLAALWPRRGWLLCLPLFILPIPESAMAIDADAIYTDAIQETQHTSNSFDLNHLWSRTDQKAMQLFNQGEHKDAASQFEDPRWKAAAHYRAGDYEQSLKTPGDSQSSDDFYNRANALAQLGKYQEALDAYDSALELNEKNDDANFNREQVKQQLESQTPESQQSESQQQESQDQQSSDNQDSENQESQQENSQQQDSEQQQSSEQNKDASEDNKQQQSPSEQDQSQQSPTDEADPSNEQKETSAREVNQALQDAQQQDNEKRTESDKDKNDTEENQQQAYNMEETLPERDPITEQWLRRIPDDPGLLLKRKFLYQYQREPNPVTSEQPW